MACSDFFASDQEDVADAQAGEAEHKRSWQPNPHIHEQKILHNCDYSSASHVPSSTDATQVRQSCNNIAGCIGTPGSLTSKH